MAYENHVRLFEMEQWGEPESLWIRRIHGSFCIMLKFPLDDMVYILCSTFDNTPQAFSDVCLAIQEIKKINHNCPVRIQYR